MPRLAPWLAACLAVAMVCIGPAQASDPYRALHRPLRLPQLAPGAKCPISKVGRGVDWEAINIFGGSGIGPGPAYPGLGGVQGRLSVPATDQHPGFWHQAKVFWYVAPSYRGPVLARGHRIDGGHASIRFGGGRFRRELRIPVRNDIAWAGQPRGSRGAPGYLRIHESGCYGVQIDGTSFSRTVIFSASTE